jgi:succinoglycan biosynthesis transport protein ExoP
MTESNEAKLHFLDYWRVVKLRLGLILLTFFLVMVSAEVYVYFLPRQFYSHVTVEIKPDVFDRLNEVGTQTSSGRTDPQFVATQIQVLRKAEILNPVIEKLNLVKELSPPGQTMPLQWVTETLSRSMVVQEQRNTTLVDIGVYHTKPELAAVIANTIAVTYRDKRIEELRKNTDQTLKEMKDELKTKEDEMARLFQEASKIRQDESISDPDPDSSNAALSITAPTGIATGETQLAETRALVDRLRSQLMRVEKLKPEELMEAARILGITDSTVEKTLPLLQDAKAEEAKFFSAGLGENHPRMKSLRAQREVYAKILSDQLDSIKRSLNTRLGIEEATLKTFETNVDKTHKVQIDEKTRMSRYVEKKSAYLMTKTLLFEIRRQYDKAKMNNILTQIPVKIWQRAQPGLYHEKPSVILYTIIAAIFGIVAGIGLAFFVEYLDTSVKTVDDIERHLSLPVLAVIPTEIVILLQQKRDTADAEAYRILKGNIELNLPDHGANTYTLVSGGPGEGKSTTLSNLAYIYAKGGANVLVVDADLRRPSQHRFFNVDNSIGLVDYLHGRKTLDEITHPSRLENLAIIPSGSLAMEDVGILNGPRMTELILQLKKRYDVVFFDSPPILGVSDASILVSEVDNTIMVVQYRRFPRNMLQRVKQTVAHVGGNLIGVVLNNVDIHQDDSYRYYSNYKDYYGPKRDTPEDRKKPEVAAANADNEDAY